MVTGHGQFRNLSILLTLNSHLMEQIYENSMLSYENHNLRCIIELQFSSLNVSSTIKDIFLVFSVMIIGSLQRFFVRGGNPFFL